MQRFPHFVIPTHQVSRFDWYQDFDTKPGFTSKLILSISTIHSPIYWSNININTTYFHYRQLQTHATNLNVA